MLKKEYKDRRKCDDTMICAREINNNSGVCEYFRQIWPLLDEKILKCRSKKENTLHTKFSNRQQPARSTNFENLILITWSSFRYAGKPPINILWGESGTTVLITPEKFHLLEYGCIFRVDSYFNTYFHLQLRSHTDRHFIAIIYLPGIEAVKFDKFGSKAMWKQNKCRFRA